MGHYIMYGAKWNDCCLPWNREVQMIRHGGQWITKDGRQIGRGLAFHFKRLQQILWPEKVWHKWNELELECFVKYRFIGEAGPAASGKTESGATNMLADWYCFPECTTVLVSSTTLASLRRRTFGRMTHYHRLAKERWPQIPGHLIEGENVIIQDERKSFVQGRDFRNGILGIACKRGDTYVGLAEYTGVHNKRVRLLADELQFMPKAFIDSISNLNKCEDFKCLGLGNPNDIANAHGLLCEPSQESGGWESAPDQRPGTKTWPTRFPDGICIQLSGDDSPNGDADDPPYPFLITKRHMQDDAKMWGTGDWHYTMMNLGRWPRGQESRRIITRQMCYKFGALREVLWRDSRRTKIGFCDAAFRATGGDRCIFGELQFGQEAETRELGQAVTDAVLSQSGEPPKAKTVIALIDMLVIPISAEKGAEEPEDQIAKFCKEQCANRGIVPENFFYDGSMRSSLVTAFVRLWSPHTNALDFGGQPSERRVSEGIDVLCCDYYSKRVTEFWYSVRLTIEAGQMRGLTEELIREGCAREWKRVKENKVEIESKEDYKLKTGRSPDCFDGLVTGLEGARQRGFSIGSLRNEEDREEDAQWKQDLRQQANQQRAAHSLNYAA